MEWVVFNLREIVGRSARTLGVRAAQKGLELTCRIDPRLPGQLIGDPNRLRQIIVNLAGNAVKFTADGEVTIDVAEEYRSSKEVCLHVSVRDTGIGIPDDKQQSVFQAFQQADESMTRKFGGTGLGLAICSQLVQMMGGRIWLESEVGKGTTFHFTALFTLANGAGTAAAHDLSELRGTRVLVVDDHPTNRRVLDEILRNWQLAPHCVSDGAGALEALIGAAKSAPFTVVLLDCMMPEMDGFAVARRIRENEDLDGTKIIMISSAAQSGDADRCRAMGIQRYITKPVIQSELLDALLGVMGRSDDVDANINLERNTPELPPMKILLVEDGIVNQRVALGFLEQWGQDVTIANNGREAVHEHARGPFDAILMDVQMPEMDGLEATRIIRASEHQSKRHTPIIAMTAAAMKGDRERCIQAGMDAYISKPIAMNDLFDALRQFSSTSTPVTDDPATRDGTQHTEEPTVHAAAFDLQAASERVQGDMASVRELAELLLIECPRLMEDIRAGFSARDAERLQRVRILSKVRLLCSRHKASKRSLGNWKLPNHLPTRRPPSQPWNSWHARSIGCCCNSVNGSHLLRTDLHTQSEKLSGPTGNHHGLIAQRVVLVEVALEYVRCRCGENPISGERHSGGLRNARWIPDTHDQALAVIGLLQRRKHDLLRIDRQQTCLTRHVAVTLRESGRDKALLELRSHRTAMDGSNGPASLVTA